MSRIFYVACSQILTYIPIELTVQHTKMITYISDKCNRLPTDLFNLRTTPSLPVYQGTKLEVGCVQGYSLSGSNVITCVMDDSWHYDHTPRCVLGKLGAERGGGGLQLVFLGVPGPKRRKIRSMPASWTLFRVLRYCEPPTLNHCDQVIKVQIRRMTRTLAMLCVQQVMWACWFTQSVNCHLPSDRCTELPAALSEMTTTQKFPVIVGTVVGVSCPPGHTQAGDTSIACVRGAHFNVQQRPTCTIGLLYLCWARNITDVWERA
jgi:hypothetical protein